MSTALENPNPNPEVPIPEAAASSGPGFLDLKPPRDCKIAKIREHTGEPTNRMLGDGLPQRAMLYPSKALSTAVNRCQSHLLKVKKALFFNLFLCGRKGRQWR